MTAQARQQPILRAEQVDKSFGITHAVNQVSLEVARGEVRGLIGENGSGKSTFCSMLAGIYRMDGGQFYINGQPLRARNQIEANHQGVSIIVQEMGTLPRHREIKLPMEIKPEQVRASFRDGILEVRLPKLVVVNAQRVTVE